MSIREVVRVDDRGRDLPTLVQEFFRVLGYDPAEVVRVELESDRIVVIRRHPVDSSYEWADVRRLR